LLKDLQEHCNDLAIILDHIGYKRTSDWLSVSSGIVKIDYQWNRFDKTESSQWCRPAWEYDVAKSEIINVYVETLTIFNYIWGSFESLVMELFSKTEIKKFGKVNCVTKLIKEKKYFPILDCSEIKKDFSIAINKIEFETLKISDKFDINGVELQLVYKIRNDFAHGDMDFPEAMDYSYSNPNNLIEIIDLSSKIVLLYIQALLIYFTENKKIFFYSDSYFNNVDTDEISEDIFIHYLLSRIHLEEIPEQDKCFTLFDEYYYNLN